MADTLPDPITLPTARPKGRPLDPPEELAALRARHPLSRMTYADGHVGWLVTGHTLTRAVVSDHRFSSRQELMRLAVPRGGVTGSLPPAPPGMFISADAPEHTRYRRLLAGKFTVRRMRALSARVERVAADHLDAMERSGPGADLVTAFAQPVPALMICELLGVPYEDHERFQGWAVLLSDGDADPQAVGEAANALGEYLYGLVLAKRARPTDDLLGDLVETDLTDGELTNIGVLLLGAGLDTTANMIALGAFALLTHPEQLAALRADPGLADNAVEELLRYLTIAHTGVRTALEDVELGGHLIRAGDSVTLAAGAANRDPEKFSAPDTLDLRRSATGHLALGHGIHQCLGQQLARVELRVALPALFDRFPSLRLAVPAQEVEMRENSDIHGAHRLPVTWDEV